MDMRMQGLNNTKKEWYLSNLLVDVSLDEQLNDLGNSHPASEHKFTSNDQSSEQGRPEEWFRKGKQKLWLLKRVRHTDPGTQNLLTQ